MSSTEETAAAPAAPAQAGGSRLLPLILVALLALAAGAGATWFVTQRRAATAGDAVHTAPGGEQEAAPTAGDAPLVDRILALDPFVVNVEGESFKRFLKARVEVEVATPGDRKLLAERTAQLRDAVIAVLGSKRLEDLDGLEGKAMLKTELHQRLADIAGPERIRSVLITEFVIQ
jgi:flagellar FliL protein